MMSMQTSRLRFALARHLGDVLTPEVAAHILAMATTEVRAAIDVKQFAPLTLDNGMTLQCERFADTLDELRPLHEAHWMETERYRHGLAFKPDYAMRLMRETMGTLLQITLRNAGELVGYLVMYPGIVDSYTGTTYAEEDALFIAESARGLSRSWSTTAFS